MLNAKSVRASFAFGLLSVSGLAMAQPVAATLVIAEGQALPGTAGLVCSAVNSPFTDGNGKVGFTGNSSGGNFVWYDTGVVWLNTNATGNVLTGAEGTMGVSNSGGYIYSPAVDGNDAVWTQAGKLLADGDAIPGTGLFSVFNSRPTMSPDGTVYWVGGTTATQGGPTTNRSFFRVANPAAPVFELLISGGLTYGGLAITTSASNFSYDVSDNNAHRIHVLTATGPTATDLFVYFSTGDLVLAREGSPVPGGASGENYFAFRIPSTNNDGDTLIVADTNSATTTADEVILFNNVIIAREADIIDGVEFAGTVAGSSLSNRDEIAVVSSGATGRGPSTLYVGPAAAFRTQARALLSVGQSIDTNNDGACDAVVTGFNASNTIGPGVDLAENGVVYVNVDLTPCAGGTAVDGIIRLRYRCDADFNGDGSPDFFDYLDFVAAFDAQSPSADFNGDNSVDFFDYLDFVAAFDAGCD
jgi:hypothetical protein